MFILFLIIFLIFIIAIIYFSYTSNGTRKRRAKPGAFRCRFGWSAAGRSPAARCSSRPLSLLLMAAGGAGGLQKRLVAHPRAEQRHDVLRAIRINAEIPKT